MLQTRTKLCLRALFIIITVTCFEHCKQEVALPRSDPDNGGLLLPKHFEALVVVDSIGNARHLAV